MSENPPLPEGFSLEGKHPPLPEGFKLEGTPAGVAQEKNPIASVVEEANRAIAKADRDYIVPIIGLPADIVGWAFDVENMPGGSDWEKAAEHRRRTRSGNTRRQVGYRNPGTGNN